MIPAIGLVVVSGGEAEEYTPEHVNVQIVDLDNIRAGDDRVKLPSGLGFEHLVAIAGIKEFVVFDEKQPWGAENLQL